MYFCNMKGEDQESSEYPEALNFSRLDDTADCSEIFSGEHFRVYKMKRYGHWCAVKGLQPDFVADTFWMGVLEKELDIGMEMSHPNIVKVLGREENSVVGQCIVMDYVDGRSLDAFLGENPSVEKRKKVVMQLLSAMRYYHSLQIVHRDLKPSNLLITRNGDDLKIIDFGMADSDYHANIKGPAYTKAYAAPEQMIAGARIDCRTDIYAFGVLLGEILPNRYRHVARRCTQSDPGRRYDNVEAVERAIKNTDTVRKSLWVALPLAVVIAVAALLWPNNDNTAPASTETSPLQYDTLFIARTTDGGQPQAEPTVQKDIATAVPKETSNSVAEMPTVAKAPPGIDEVVERFQVYCDKKYSEFLNEVSAPRMYHLKALVLASRKTEQMSLAVFTDFLPMLPEMSPEENTEARGRLFPEVMKKGYRMREYIDESKIPDGTHEQERDDTELKQLSAECKELKKKVQKLQYGE